MTNHVSRFTFHVLLLALCLPAHAAYISFSFTNFDGTAMAGAVIKVSPVGDPAVDASGNITAAIGLPTKITLGADGRATNFLQPQNYFVTNTLGGPNFLGKGYLFRAPIDNGPTVYPSAGPGQLITGNNYFVTLIVTNGGAGGSITFNQITNGLGYVPFSATNLTGLTNTFAAMIAGTNTVIQTQLANSNSLYQAQLAATNTGIQSQLSGTNLNLIALLAATNSGLQTQLANTNSALLADLAATNAGIQTQLANTNSALQAQIAAVTTTTNGLLSATNGTANAMTDYGLLSMTNAAGFGWKISVGNVNGQMNFLPNIPGFSFSIIGLSTNGTVTAPFFAGNGSGLTNTTSTNLAGAALNQVTNVVTSLTNLAATTAQLAATNLNLLALLAATNSSLQTQLANTNTAILTDLVATNSGIQTQLANTNTALQAQITTSTNGMLQATNGLANVISDFGNWNMTNAAGFGWVINVGNVSGQMNFIPRIPGNAFTGIALNTNGTLTVPFYIGNGYGLSNTSTTNLTLAALNQVTNIVISLTNSAVTLAQLTSTNSSIQTQLANSNTLYQAQLAATNLNLIALLNSTNGGVQTQLANSNTLYQAQLAATNANLLALLNSTNGGIQTQLANSNTLYQAQLAATNANLLALLNSTNSGIQTQLANSNTLVQAQFAAKANTNGSIIFASPMLQTTQLVIGTFTNKSQSTNFVAFKLAGDALTTSAVFQWVPAMNVYSNLWTGYTITNNSGTFLLKNTAGSSLYSLTASIPVGTWTDIGGGSPAAQSDWGIGENGNGMNILGVLTSTNLNYQITNDVAQTVSNSIIAISPNTWTVDAAIGNDTIGRPFKHIASARDQANTVFLSTGIFQNVVVNPGTYAENDLLRQGVNYNFLPGAIVSYSQTTTNDAGWGIFDDRTAGGTTNIIDGSGTFFFQSYTGRVVGPATTYNTNSLGVIVLTNPATVLHCKGDTIDTAFFKNVGFLGGSLVASIAVLNCQESFFDFKRITDRYRYPSNISSGFTGWPFWNRISNGNAVSFFPIDAGIYWATGNCHFNIGVNAPGGPYSIWGNVDAASFPGLGTTNAAQLWYHGDFLSHKIYMDNTSTSNDWRSWIVINNLEWDGMAGFLTENGADYYGAGKHYLTAQKIFAGSDNCIGLVTTYTTNLQVWANVQKCAASNSWIDCTGGQLIANVEQFEDVGGVGTVIPVGSDGPGGINISGFAKADITFQQATVTNAGAVGAYANGLKLTLSQGTIDTSAGGANAWPILYRTNSTVGGPGNGSLILKNLTLVASNNVFAINSTNGCNVVANGVYSHSTNALLVTNFPAGQFFTNNLIQ